MAKETVFSKIIEGKIPSDKIYEDDLILSFHNIAPEARIHALVIPKSNHLERISEAQPKDIELLGYMMSKIPEIAKKLELHESGYRVITNSGKDSGQEVDHLHFHIIGGEKLAGFNGN